MSFIGNTPTSQSFISGTDYFNGTGSQTAFTLTRTISSVNDISVVINNVVQQPNTAYTVLGNVVTFTSAPSAGTANIYVRYLSTITQSIAPSQGTVGLSQLTSDLQSKVGIGFKNRIINGAMVIDQRNAGASVTVNDTGIYTLDRWVAVDLTDGSFTLQQVTDAPSGFTNSLKVTVTSADASLGSGQWAAIRQPIEGFNVADLGFGTANARTVTVSFWVKSSLTGVFGGSLQNGAQDRGYPFTYTISVANTWEYKTLTITGDTSGTWLTNNGVGLRLTVSLGSNSANAGTAGVWTAGAFYTTTGATSVVGTSGATFYITGVQLEVGTQATTFDYRSIGTELALCQRYYWQRNYTVIYENILDPCRVSGTDSVTGTFIMPVSMRTSPSVSNNGAGNFRVNDSLTHDQVCSSITLVGSDTNKATLTFTKATGNMTVGTVGYVNTEATNDAAVYFSAEL